jgi:tetratricopeptide (TPR) repeat protein
MAPKEARYWQTKAMFLLKLEESELALPCVNKSLQLNSNSDYAYVLKADILSSLNRFEEAFSIINHRIKLNPCSENLVTKAKIFMRQGKYELAEKELDKLVNSNSNDALARQKRAIVAIRLKHWQKAIEDLSFLIDKAQVKNTSYYEDLLARAKAYTANKQYEKAIADCKAGLKGQPEVPQFYAALLKVYEASGNASEAKRMRKELDTVEDDFRPPRSYRY